MQEHGEIKGAAKTVINQEMENIYQGKTALELNEEFIAANPESVEHRLAGWFLFIVCCQHKYFVLIC